MPPVLDKKLGRSMKTLLKASMKGRPVHFGMQVAGSRLGKFLVNKKAGEVKKAKLESTDLYVGKGKDEAEAKKKNEVSAPGVAGVCKGEKGSGTLTLYVTTGTAAGSALKFVKYFINVELKYRAVKVVVLAGESEKAPEVAENPPDAQTLTGDLEQLKSRLGALGTVAGAATKALTKLFDDAGVKLVGDDLTGADDALLLAEGLLTCLEEIKLLRTRATTLQSNAESLKDREEDQGEIETFVKDALARLTAAEQILGSADREMDVEAACALDLDAAEELLEKGEALLGGPSSGVQPGHGAYLANWLGGLPGPLNEVKQNAAGLFQGINAKVDRVKEHVDKEEWDAALKLAGEVDGEIAAALRQGRASKDGAEVSAGKGGEVAALRSDLAKVRLDAERGVAQLAVALRAAGDPRAAAVAGVITTLATSFPKQAEGLLNNLRTAYEANDADKAAGLKTALKSASAEWANFLKTHEKSIAGCEANPFNVAVSIRQPVRDNLQKIVTLASSK